MGVRFAGQFMLVTSWTYFIVYLLVLVISLSAIGHFKLAQLSLGPITVMAAGVQAAVIALAAKRFQVDTRRALRFLFLAGVGHGRGDPAVDRPDLPGPRARHDHRPGPVMAPGPGPGALSSAWASPSTPFSGAATSGLRAVRAARENLRLALIMLPFLFVPCMGGAALWGARGAAIGLCISYTVYAVLGWFLLVRVVRHFEPSVVAPTPR